jgi:hypothetical protein
MHRRLMSGGAAATLVGLETEHHERLQRTECPDSDSRFINL